MIMPIVYPSVSVSRPVLHLVREVYEDGQVKVEMTTNEKMRRMLFLLSKGMENPKQVGGQNDT